MFNKFNLSEWLIEKISLWLLHESPPTRGHLSNISTIAKQIVPGDVLLIEGRSRASIIIKQVTQSPWSHAALYIGRIEDIKDHKFRDIVDRLSSYPKDTQLLIESEVGMGTMLAPVSKYKLDHIRLLRPRELTAHDAQQVINYAITRIGRRYNLRHLFDLARFLFPWGLFPRKWRSSLFKHNALQPTEDICSSMIAEAFQSVGYPILPAIRENSNQEIELIERNSNLFTPSDFDYSPFFDIIKYPIIPLGAKGKYRHHSWRFEE